MKSKLLCIFLILFVQYIKSYDDNKKLENNEPYELKAPEVCRCICKIKYKKRCYLAKKHCSHEKCCQKINRTTTGALLGSAVGMGVGGVVGASMTPAAIGTGIAIGGPVGLVGGMILSKIV